MNILFGWLMMLPFILVVVGFFLWMFWSLYKSAGLKTFLIMLAGMIGIGLLQVLFFNGLKLIGK